MFLLVYGTLRSVVLRVAPNFVKCCVKRSSVSTKKKLEEWIRSKWVETEIRRWHELLNSFTKLLDATRLRLIKIFQPGSFDDLLREVYLRQELLREELKSKKDKNI